MKKLLALLMVAVLGMSVLTACSKTEEPKDNVEDAGVVEDVNNDDTNAEDVNAEDANAEDADSEAENAATGEVLVVGTNAEFPPFEYVGDDGEPDGFDIALIKAIGEKMGREVKVENMAFDSLVTAIGSKIDIAIAGMTVTEERLEAVDFSDNYYTALQYVIVPADSEIATAEDLVGKTIGVQLGTTGDFIASDDIADSNVSAYNKAVDAVNDLINGRVDCVIIDKNPALVFAEEFEGQVKAIDGAEFGFAEEYYAIALPKGDTELAEAINTALKELKEDGTFDALVEQYIEN